MYSVGGYDPLQQVEVADVMAYVPDTDSWVAATPLPYAVDSLAAAEHQVGAGWEGRGPYAVGILAAAEHRGRASGQR